MGFALLVVPASAQQPSLGVKLSKFNVPVYYEPPHQTQLRWLLKGAQATPQTNGTMLVEEVTLEEFQAAGAREMLIETPDCLFSYATREASSARPLKMLLQEGRFALEGEGFLWRQTNALLVISNRVRTTVRGGWLESTSSREAQAEAPALGDVRILADQFIYDGKTTQAVYRGSVRVTATNLSLACEALTFRLPTSGVGAVDRLVAEQRVAIDYGELHATGEQAVFSPGDGMIQLTGQAQWQAQAREGRGDELLLNSTTTTLQVNGSAKLKLPISGTGFLPQEAAVAQTADATDRFVTITSERYEIQTSRASFTGGVEAVERAGNVTRARLTCSSLVAMFGGSNQVQQLVAEQRVVIEQGERRLAGEQARYDGASGVAELTGQPTWRDGDRSGRGEVLLANLQRSHFIVRGDASLTLPRAEAGSLLNALAIRPDEPAVAKPIAHSGAADGPPTLITCNEYELSPEAVAFRGRVRAEDTQMRLTCDTLTVKLSPGGTNVVGITADQNVVMSLIETNGQVTTATCAQAVYAAADEVLELLGQPLVRRSDGSSFTAPVVKLNRATGTVSALGKARAVWLTPGNETNSPVLPFDRKPNMRKKRTPTP
ncbi:MAG TPA: LptA/OstA family protein [Verrucomicrobiae bacterium]